MRDSSRGFLVLALALTVSGCPSPYVAVPLAAHPSGATGGTSIGTSVGGVVGTGADSNIIAVPYNESWLRLGAGSGQLHLHLGPGVASAGYRFDLQPLSAGTGFAVEPFGGAGYYRLSEGFVDSAEEEEAAYALILAGGLRLHVLVPTGAGFFYVSPVIGITGFVTNDELEGNEIMTLGTAVGINLGGHPGTSLELTVHRLSSTDDFGEDVWIFGPSVGFQL